MGRAKSRRKFRPTVGVGMEWQASILTAEASPITLSASKVPSFAKANIVDWLAILLLLQEPFAKVPAVIVD